MTADPYARLDAAYLLGALDAGPQPGPGKSRTCARGGTRRAR